MNGPCYRIRNWPATYENANSRKLDRLNWVAMPITMEGRAYKYIASYPKGAAYLGIWTSLVFLAARSPKPFRGCLLDEAGPLDADDIALQTGFPLEDITDALKILAGPKIGWLQQVELRNGEAVEGDEVAESANRVAESADRVAESPNRVAESPNRVAESPNRVAESANGSAAAAGRPAESAKHSTGQYKTRQDSTGQDRTGPDRTGQNKTEQNRTRGLAESPNPLAESANGSATDPKATEQDRTEQNRTEQDRTEQGQILPAGRRRRPGPGSSKPKTNRRTRRPKETTAGNNGNLQRFFQLFVIDVCQAAGMPESRWPGQRQAITSVARRIIQEPNPEQVRDELVALAAQKRQAGMSKPMAAWQAEVNRRFPPLTGEQHKRARA